MQCAQEGTDYRQTQTWTLSGNTLGAQSGYRRRGLSKRGAAIRDLLDCGYL